MPIIKVTPPAESPVDLATAKTQCQIDADIVDEDSLIEGMIKAATEYCEKSTGLPLITQEKQYIGCFSSVIELTPNLLSVESIKYVDTEGVEQTLSADQYYNDIASVVGKVIKIGTYPSTQATHPQPVTISFTCGYGDADAVPDSIKQCILMLVGHWYRNRESVSVGTINSEMEFTTTALLNNYRLVRI